MRERVLGLFLSVLLGACGCKATNYVDPKLQAYVDAFVSLSEEEKVAQSLEGLGLVVVFGDVSAIVGDSTAVGVCQQSVLSNKVTIDLREWQVLSEGQRQALVNHELGHCVLDRKHRTDLIGQTGCSQSTMYPYLEDDYCIEQFSAQYNYELFHQGYTLVDASLGNSSLVSTRASTGRKRRVD